MFYYRPRSKDGEGNVFTGVSVNAGEGGTITGPSGGGGGSGVNLSREGLALSTRAGSKLWEGFNCTVDTYPSRPVLAPHPE